MFSSALSAGKFRLGMRGPNEKILLKAVAISLVDALQAAGHRLEGPE